ncbi:MAG TPA: oligopeptide/dipeptide ABC transporter ATP-binding protein, partial [bacterium]
VMEQATVKELFGDPKHPYTQGLLASLPKMNSLHKEKLNTIPGIVPSLYDLPIGCKFAPRCSFVMDVCHYQEPDLKKIKTGHFSRCWLN